MCKKYYSIRYKRIRTCKNRFLKYEIYATSYEFEDYYY